jgi:hypothetical protein
LRILDLSVTGRPLDPGNTGSIIKLVDAVEISALNRSELVLYNQLLAHAWNDIEPGKVYRIRKSVLRGSHDSEAFDRLMGAFAKVRYRDRTTGKSVNLRMNLLGPNAEEEEDDGTFSYTFHPTLLTILEHSHTWQAAVEQ